MPARADRKYNSGWRAGEGLSDTRAAKPKAWKGPRNSLVNAGRTQRRRDDIGDRAME